MSARDVPTLIDALISARRWTSEECVRHFTDAAIALEERATLSDAQLKRWRRGRLTGLPRPTACRVAEHLFGYPAEDLFAPVPPGYVSSTESRSSGGPKGIRERIAEPLMQSDMLSVGSSAEAGTHFSILESDSIMSAAHDASEHAADAGRAIAEATLEQLHAEVVRLAHTYAATSPVVIFGELKHGRDMAYRMLERTRRPAQTTDLYLIAGQLSGLMAGASFDLGQADAAAEQARAALAYGEIIDHPSLRGWARATLSMIAFWSGRPAEGVRHAQAGLEHASHGGVAVRLHAVEARAWALASAPDQAHAALRASQDMLATDDGTDDLADGIGGEFAFGRARQELSAGATLLALGEGGQAAVHARAAVDLYEALPVEQRWVGGLHGARVDLATAHCQALDLDATREVLVPTFALTPQQRTERVISRMRNLRQQVGVAKFRGSLQASTFAEEIEEFTASGISLRALPGGA